MARTCRRWASAAIWLVGLLLLTMTGPVQAQEQTFRQEQLDQMLAPIALYPDSLLSQVLMASTYPANVAQAVQWSRTHPKSQGDAAVKEVANEPWDPSVKSLVAFPQVLVMMGQKPEWVQSLGDAFLAQPSDVMNSVQKLRHAAQQSGNLKTTSQQKVVVEPTASGTEPSTIVIQPANPQVVYVPSYNPTVVYGSWWYPAYPPVYMPPPPGYALASGIAFGVGVAITYALWGNCNWNRGNVDIDVNRYNNINVNNRINSRQNLSNWQHNSNFRGGVPYRSQALQQRYRQQTPGGGNRNYRGFDNNGAIDQRRQNAQNELNRRGMNPGQDRQRPPSAQNRMNNPGAASPRDNMQNRPSAGNNARPNWKQNDHALGGNGGGAPDWRQQANRGNTSRQHMQRPSGRAQQPSFNRSRGGGGGGGFRRR